MAVVSLGSLVFDFEVAGSVDTRVSFGGQTAASALHPLLEHLAREKEKLQFIATPASLFEGKLLRDVRYFLKEESDTDVILLATKLSAVGYSVNVRTALGGGGTAGCFRNLRHEFLTVRGRGVGEEAAEFIVEPRFREHFYIPHPTDEYTEMLAAAPDVFVGTSARLVPIVQLLCALMASSFERQGLTLPPWRRTGSMLSKWLPNRSRDTPAGGGGPFARASAPPAAHVREEQKPRAQVPPQPQQQQQQQRALPLAAASGAGGGGGSAALQVPAAQLAAVGGTGGTGVSKPSQQYQHQQQPQHAAATIAQATVRGVRSGTGGVGVGRATSLSFSRISDPLSVQHWPQDHAQQQQQQQQHQHQHQQAHGAIAAAASGRSPMGSGVLPSAPGTPVAALAPHAHPHQHQQQTQTQPPQALERAAAAATDAAQLMLSPFTRTSTGHGDSPGGPQGVNGPAAAGDVCHRGGRVRQDSTYDPFGFVPFGGRNMYGSPKVSDESGMSPPAPPFAYPYGGLRQQPQPQQTAVAAAAPTPLPLPVPALQSTASVSAQELPPACRRAPSGLLAARLQQTSPHGGAAQPGAAAAASGGASGAAVAATAVVAMETRPPAHWGDVPIHKVRMGHAAATAAPAGAAAPLLAATPIAASVTSTVAAVAPLAPGGGGPACVGTTATVSTGKQ
ncbi:hypothetical protein CHLRE_16g693819v5 [Chlamydomonas reinhardtii]|uniref:Uncharacterized protein n=1 Tax=Chlamydomonas reinhardtii TaxID=3055 RepID=A0A2K3CSC2_CHLRE|nr:uncharacterized protein CHLRE_16g693819v5 [Chlamydomonas reinhardtii]PNW71197.1 hypothetical protein CHLRE_16g693819v5 [Chlamydomonas reinhardtii]